VSIPDAAYIDLERAGEVAVDHLDQDESRDKASLELSPQERGRHARSSRCSLDIELAQFERDLIRERIASNCELRKRAGIKEAAGPWSYSTCSPHLVLLWLQASPCARLPLVGRCASVFFWVLILFYISFDPIIYTFSRANGIIHEIEWNLVIIL
jgi:hypothetical protein